MASCSRPDARSEYRAEFRERQCGGGWILRAGSLKPAAFIANRIVDVLHDSERFCFHMAAEMKPLAAEKWIELVRAKALLNAKRELAPLIDQKLAALAAWRILER